MTEPERLLTEWRKAAEQKNKQTDEYIAMLKSQLDSLSNKTAHASGYDHEEQSGKSNNLRAQLEDSHRREKALKDENARLVREVEKSRMQAGSSTSSIAFRAGVGSGQMGAGDERAVRRLYEDLTGIVVNNVEQLDGRDQFRRFHAIFACAGYHGTYKSTSLFIS